MAAPATRIETADVLSVDEAVQRSTGGGDFGLGPAGFLPKPYARLLAEKLALARSLLGADLDLGSGSLVRKVFELSALEDARTWAALAALHDDLFVSSARGDALSRLGEELGLPRPWLEARGQVTLQLVGAVSGSLQLRRGARLLTAGGHHAALSESVTLSAASPRRDAAVEAFYPGPEHDLDPAAPGPGGTPQKIVRWNAADPVLQPLLDAAGVNPPESIVQIQHTQPLTGGEQRWPDDRYRALLLRAPRSVWTADAVRIAVSLVPGVRQAQVRDPWGGLDIDQSIFGNFNFIERLFSEERDLASPYYFTVLVAPTPAAIWEGPGGLRASVADAIEDLRPLGIFPRIEKADEIGVGLRADLVVRGLPLPRGTRDDVNASPPAVALKQRLVARVRRYVDDLSFGEPVRAAEVTRALLDEPGVADVQQLALLRWPPGLADADLALAPVEPHPHACGENVAVQQNQIALLVDDPAGLRIV